MKVTQNKLNDIYFETQTACHRFLFNLPKQPAVLTNLYLSLHNYIILY